MVGSEAASETEAWLEKGLAGFGTAQLGERVGGFGLHLASVLLGHEGEAKLCFRNNRFWYKGLRLSDTTVVRLVGIRGIVTRYGMR
jgi:hypothetical protein